MLEAEERDAAAQILHSRPRNGVQRHSSVVDDRTIILKGVKSAGKWDSNLSLALDHFDGSTVVRKQVLRYFVELDKSLVDAKFAVGRAHRGFCCESAVDSDCGKKQVLSMFEFQFCSLITVCRTPAFY